MCTYVVFIADRICLLG